jgi:MFS transporter, putative metabolite:H+ symporter
MIMMQLNLDNNTRNLIIVAALGYFVDIYDLVLFSIVRVSSLSSIGVPQDELLSQGIFLINSQMIGMLVGGVLWGILGDKRGRISVLFGSIFLYSIANIVNAFVNNVDQYALVRFIAGVGLAGELGAGITLVAETMSKEKRGIGTLLVAGIGVLGAVAAALLAEHISWQSAYLVGGILGLGLLFMRVGVYDSSMFETAKKNARQRGSFALIFKDFKTARKYIYCIFIGLPVWFAIGIPVTFTPEFGQALGFDKAVSAGSAILYSYIGLAAGDIASGLLSQILKSRKKALNVFLILFTVVITLMFYATNLQERYWYVWCTALGFSVGFWALFVTVAAEQFGTNIRATVTTTVPNFVRAAVVPITLSFSILRPGIGLVNAAFAVGIVCLFLALFASNQLPESFGKDLNYNEEE